MNIIAINLTFNFYIAKANISGWLKVSALGKGRKWAVCGPWFLPVLPHFYQFQASFMDQTYEHLRMPQSALGTEALKASPWPQEKALWVPVSTQSHWRTPGLWPSPGPQRPRGFQHCLRIFRLCTFDSFSSLPQIEKLSTTIFFPVPLPIRWICIIYSKNKNKTKSPQTKNSNFQTITSCVCCKVKKVGKHWLALEYFYLLVIVQDSPTWVTSGRPIPRLGS